MHVRKRTYIDTAVDECLSHATISNSMKMKIFTYSFVIFSLHLRNKSNVLISLESKLTTMTFRTHLDVKVKIMYEKSSPIISFYDSIMKLLSV